MKTTRRLAMLLGPLGLASRQLRDGGCRRGCYVLEAERLAELRERYVGR